MNDQIITESAKLLGNGHNTIALLTNFGIIELTGKDPGGFLQGQLTCDIRQVTASQVSPFAYCNTKGRVVVSGVVYQIEQGYRLIVPQSMVELTLKVMNKYAALSRVKLSHISVQSIMSIAGLTLDAMISHYHLPTENYQMHAWQEGQIIKMPGIISRFWLINRPDILATVSNQLADKLITIPADIARWYDMNAGWTYIYPATTELFTPQMLNYPELGAVSFRKGCYLGQEIVARAHYLGKTKRHLKKFTINGPAPQPGVAIINNKQEEIGNVTESVQITKNDYLGLAVIQEINQEEALLIGQFPIMLVE